VRDKTNSISCMNNIRQIGSGMLVYASESNGFIALAGAASPYWYDTISNYVDGASLYSKRGVWTCPATKKNSWLGYGLSYATVGLSPAAMYLGPFQIGSGRDSVVMMADSGWAEEPGGFLRGAMGLIYLPFGGARPSRIHNNGYNIFFMDGHVQWHQTDKAYLELRWY
jgi:prepilin-type processing-associated H-X9-DG protein